MNSVISTKKKWAEFLTRYYKPEIARLAVSTARLKSLTIKFSDLVKYDVRLSEELVQNPGKVIKDAEDAVPLVDMPVPGVRVGGIVMHRQLNAFVRFTGLQRKTLIRDIRAPHVNMLVSMDCTVRNISAVTQRIVVGAFECARCGNMVYLPQEGSGKFLEPSYCKCNEEKKGVFRLMYKESTFEDY
jgi:replicative DNA helicase Mcm